MNTKTKSSVQLSNQHGSILLNGLGHAWIQTNAHGFPCRLSLLDHPIPNPATPDPATTGWLQRLLQWWQDPSIQLAACPLPQGTPWQQQVWSLLTTIPSGATRSYSEIALILGKPSAQRAVARACACNPLPLFIPCHRVIAHNGNLSGYRFGLERKRLLLQRELSIS